MFEKREALMVPANGGTPNLKKAHFLQPTFDPRNELLPKPPYLPPSSKPNMKQLKKSVAFKGRPIPQEKWDVWVQKLHETHQYTWKKVGIFDAIRASTYSIRKHNELIIKLTENWCPETNTFIFQWGESTISLEDVMILGGFSVVGESVKTPFQSKEIVEMGNQMINFFINSRGVSKKGPMGHYEWMNFFMGVGCELEHMAFLTLWLSRYVFSANHYSVISQIVVPIAISLAKGTRIALAPAVLALIYKEMSLLKGKILGFMNDWFETKLVLWAPFHLVQIWAWERFPTLGPEPTPLRLGEPRLARWQNLEKLKHDCFLIELDYLGETFVWRPYACFVENWQCPEFYGNEERLVLINSEVGEELLSFAKCLRPCELVGLDCCEQYLPHRVALQFGMDQDIPSSMPRLNGDTPLDGVELYLSPRLLEGAVTSGYFDWFRKAICSGNNDVFNFKRKRRLNKPTKRETFQLPEDFDVCMKDNRKRARGACLTSLFDVPIAAPFADGAAVGNMHIEVTPYLDKSGIPRKGKRSMNSRKRDLKKSKCLPCKSPNTLKIKLSKKLDESAEKKLGPLSCLTSSCNAIISSSFVQSSQQNSECLPCKSPIKVKIKLPKNFDGIADKNMGSVSCLTSCNAAKSSSFVHSTGQNSDCLPCQSPMLVKSNQSQNVDKGVEDNSEGDNLCLPSSCNVTMDSGDGDSILEQYIESIPPCEKNTSCKKSHADNDEILPSQSHTIATREAVCEMGLLMEKSLNRSSLPSTVSVQDMLVNVVPSCDKLISASQVTRRDMNEVQVPDTEKPGEMDTSMSCTGTTQEAEGELGLLVEKSLNISGLPSIVSVQDKLVDVVPSCDKLISPLQVMRRDINEVREPDTEIQGVVDTSMTCTGTGDIITTQEAEGELGLLMEKSLNTSGLPCIVSVQDMRVDVVPSCDRIISPSKVTQRDMNEAQEPDTEKQGEMDTSVTCLGTWATNGALMNTDDKLETEKGPIESDSGLVASDDDHQGEAPEHEMSEEVQIKIKQDSSLVTVTDDREAAEFVNLQFGNGSLIEKSLNTSGLPSIVSVQDMRVDVVPSCDKIISPSQVIQRDMNEVQEPDAEKQGEIDTSMPCSGTGDKNGALMNTDDEHETEKGQIESDSGLVASDGDHKGEAPEHETTEDVQIKSKQDSSPVTVTDDREAAEFVNLQFGNGSLMEKSLNINGLPSVDSVQDMRVNVVPSCKKIISTSQVTRRDMNEVQEPDTEKQGEMDTSMPCSGKGDKNGALMNTDDKQETEKGPIESDSGLVASDADHQGEAPEHETTEEVQIKSKQDSSPVTVTDDPEAAEFVNLQFGKGSSRDDPLIIDDEDGNVNLNILDMMGSKLISRVSKLEKIVHRMYAALGRSKAK